MAEVDLSVDLHCVLQAFMYSVFWTAANSASLAHCPQSVSRFLPEVGLENL